jgi:hypothetical protein
MHALSRSLSPGSQSLALFALALTFVAPAPLRAALGDSQATLEAEVVTTNAAPRLLAAPAYTVVETQTAQAVSVRQYLSSNGVVFAVTWQGPFKPDLRQLLGTYFLSYSTAQRVAGSQRLRTIGIVNQPDVVVLSGGRPRAFVGSAYLPALVPRGVDVSSLP